MQRGRPLKSVIRENIIEILYVMGEGYAYKIHKIYIDIFPGVTMRSIYYHLRKGEDLKEFNVKRVVKEKGEYSWGAHAEKIYYELGPEAEPRGIKIVRDYFDSKK